MTDIIHTHFTDVYIKLKGNHPYTSYVSPETVNKYAHWLNENVKSGTYLIYRDTRIIQLLSEDLILFTLVFGKVYEIVPSLNKMSKIEKLLLRERDDTDN
jgi:hypothetical protein